MQGPYETNMWFKAGEEMDVGDGILFVVSTFSGYNLSMGKNLKLLGRSFTMFGARSVGTHDLVLSTPRESKILIKFSIQDESCYK